MTKRIEYRIRQVPRYVVTRYEQEVHSEMSSAGKSTQHGTFDSYDLAFEVAYALCSFEHACTREPAGSPNFIYPEQRPDSVKEGK